MSDVLPVGYTQAVTPVMALWIFASAAELPLVRARPHPVGRRADRGARARGVDRGLDDLPSSVRTLQPEETAEGTRLRVGVSGRADVTVDLHRALVVRPREVVRTIRQRAAAHEDA